MVPLNGSHPSQHTCLYLQSSGQARQPALAMIRFNPCSIREIKNEKRENVAGHETYSFEGSKKRKLPFVFLTVRKIEQTQVSLARGEANVSKLKIKMQYRVC